MAAPTPDIKAIFIEALDRASHAERAAYLDRACAGSPDVRARVEALLAAIGQAGSFLEVPAMARPAGAGPGPDHADATVAAGPDPRSPPVDVEPTAAAEDGETPGASPGPDAEGPGARIGPYKLLQEIGAGGMGTVYLAEQERPVRRQVALKLIKPGMDSRNVLARFDSERQALALMDHPNIARVFDAGSTDSGRPFFVMELVKGIPLTEYCDRHRLSLPERLALVRPICSAVQHAHQKGIIHRDLKPTNILVESHDGRPVPKVIDFGLAKATGGLRLTEQSLFTAFGGVAGTPLYMAPEQATWSALDVDTRADVYALGVILYELVTGSTPITRESMQHAALDEILRVIREVDPPTPSSRIGTSEALPSLAASRQVEPARLSRLVRGELDWIVMKALAKERDRRYDSAIGLADDIERYLDHQPVSAGPPTAGYRLRKFVRRHRVQVMAAVLVLLALVLGVVGTTLGLIEARRQQRIAVGEAKAREQALIAEADQRRIADDQRRQAERRLSQVQEMNEILGSIFADLDPQNSRSDERPLRAVLGERLDRATAEIEGEATGDPLAVARMQMILAGSQCGLGFADRGIALYSRARATFVARLGPDHPETLDCMNKLAGGYLLAGQHERALTFLEEALPRLRSKLGPDHPETLDCMNKLAHGYSAAGQNGRAMAILEESLALTKSKYGPDHPRTFNGMNNLAIVYELTGQFERALKLREETLALTKLKLGPGHLQTLGAMHGLANSYAAAGRGERALKLREETLALVRTKLAPDHPLTLICMNNLANSYAAAGRDERSLKLREETVALMKTKLGPDHPHTLKGIANLANNYSVTGQHGRALKLYEETVALMKTKLGPDHPDTLQCLEGQARCLANSGQIDLAGALLDSVIASRRKTQGDGQAPTLRARLVRAELDLARRRLDLAEAADRAILDECRARLGPDDPVTIAAGLAPAQVREARGDRDAAAPLYRAALESARRDPADRRMLATALTESGRSRLAARDAPAAVAMLREALAIREVEMPQHWLTADSRSLLGEALLAQRKVAEAAPLLRSGYEGMARQAAAIPLVDRPRLAEALDRLIAAGAAAGSMAEVEAWKAARAKLGVGAATKPGAEGK